MNRFGLGERIKAARKEQHLTSDKLSELIGKSPISIRQMESSARLPSLPTFVDLCNELHVSADYLLTDSLTSEPIAMIETVSERLHKLSPRQAEMALSMINSIIDNIEKG